ncbi:MAG: benzoate/H(+) symporter BenE family transporter [Pseudomonadota bacterium]|nr:benzoate/H(+) symporter BenE family transporter [Pseudomonadota bacterium]
MQLEKLQLPLPSVKKIYSDISITHISNALIAFLFAASAPVAIMLGVGLKGGLTESDMASWLFGSFVLNGCIGIIISLLYRQPLVFFWTISGTVLVGPALEHLSFPEVIGAFYGTGFLLLFLGLTGWVRKIMSILPMPIIMAMVAGVFLNFGLDWIKSIAQDPWIAIPMTLAFIILSFNETFSRRLPPMIGVLIIGMIAIYSTNSFKITSDFNLNISAPNMYIPVFSWSALFELVVPLTVTVLAAQNAQGIAILSSRGHNPPTNTITAACGIGAIISAIFGAVSTCLTGPVNAILSSGGKRNEQYVAALFICLLAILFGLYALQFTKLMLATPPAFISTLAGLALLRILQNAFVVSFKGNFSLGALISFLVTLADQSIYNIGAPFWGLVFGFVTSWLLEKNNFSKTES